MIDVVDSLYCSYHGEILFGFTEMICFQKNNLGMFAGQSPKVRCELSKPWPKKRMNIKKSPFANHEKEVLVIG
jgi:hypothetical protein